MDELEMKRQILERLEAVDIPLPRKFNKTEFNVYSFSNDIAPLAYTAAINILHYCNSVKHAQKYDAKGALKTVLSIWSDAAAEKNRRYHDGYISELQSLAHNYADLIKEDTKVMDAKTIVIEYLNDTIEGVALKQEEARLLKKKGELLIYDNVFYENAIADLNQAKSNIFDVVEVASEKGNDVAAEILKELEKCRKELSTNMLTSGGIKKLVTLSKDWVALKNSFAPKVSAKKLVQAPSYEDDLHYYLLCQRDVAPKIAQYFKVIDTSSKQFDNQAKDVEERMSKISGEMQTIVGQMQNGVISPADADIRLSRLAEENGRLSEKQTYYSSIGRFNETSSALKNQISTYWDIVHAMPAANAFLYKIFGGIDYSEVINALALGNANTAGQMSDNDPIKVAIIKITQFTKTIDNNVRSLDIYPVIMDKLKEKQRASQPALKQKDPAALYANQQKAKTAMSAEDVMAKYGFSGGAVNPIPNPAAQQINPASLGDPLEEILAKNNAKKTPEDV